MVQLRNMVFLAVILALLTAGCYRETTVILPPETDPGPSSAATEPTNGPTVPPVTVPATEPVTEPPTEATAPPETEPIPETSAPPVTAPTTPPETEPIAEPTFPAMPEPTDPPREPDIYDHPIGSLEWEILDALNSRRSPEGLPALSMERPLCALSSIRATECAQSLSPARPDGRDWSSVLSDHDYMDWSCCSEIRLHASQGLPVSILVDTWMSDERSKDEILSSDLRTCGIGVLYQGNAIYIVVIFTG